jgi:hypothetical protein
MRKLLLLGAVDKPQLPMFLILWVEKSSPLCKYTITQTRIWSVPHFKTSCSYINCKKIYCPVEEEDVKKDCAQADSKGAALGPDHGEEQDDKVEVDLDGLPKEEKNKMINQRARDAKKAKEKAEKEAQKAKDKEEREAKKSEKASKSKAMAALRLLLLLAQTSTGLLLQNPRKQDATFAQLSISRLQQSTSPALKDCAGDTFHIDEFFLSRSLHTTDVHTMCRNAFSKEWVDMQAFLEKVFLFSCLPLLHDGIAQILQCVSY